MRLLILGGTRFVGRHLLDAARAAGHAVTLLHRGVSAGPASLPGVGHRIADRDTSLGEALADGDWDACIDTSAYFPRQVQQAATALRGRVGRYVLVSSISVYADTEGDGLDEGSPLRPGPPLGHATVDGDSYGGLKAQCERAAFDGFGDAARVSRPGLIVGPLDPTGRFTWWVRRAGRAGPLPAPGDPQAPVQWIDVRDVAAWLLRQADPADAASPAVANVVGPDRPCSMGTFVETVCASVGAGAEPVWIDEATLLAAGVQPWTGLPLWLPRSSSAMHRVDARRARAAGLACRPLAATVADTAAWAAADPHGGHPAPPADGAPPRAPVGLDPAREAVLLTAAGRTPRP